MNQEDFDNQRKLSLKRTQKLRELLNKRQVLEVNGEQERLKESNSESPCEIVSTEQCNKVEGRSAISTENLVRVASSRTVANRDFSEGQKCNERSGNKDKNVTLQSVNKCGRKTPVWLQNLMPLPPHCVKDLTEQVSSSQCKEWSQQIQITAKNKSSGNKNVEEKQLIHRNEESVKCTKYQSDSSNSSVIRSDSSSDVGGALTNLNILEKFRKSFFNPVLNSKVQSESPECVNAIETEISSPPEQQFPIEQSNFVAETFFKTELEFDKKYLFDDAVVSVLSQGCNMPRAIRKVEDIGFCRDTVDRLKELGFCNPSLVQCSAWPSIARGRSVVLIAPKGSGKSLSYLLPLLSNVQNPKSVGIYSDLPPGCGPVVLVLCSNWEICQRLYMQSQLLSPKGYSRQVVTIYGGAAEDHNLTLLSGCDILITTPAYYSTLTTTEYQSFMSLDRCCHLVLDDADILIECFTEKVLKVIRDFKQSLKRRGRNCSTPNQLIACSTRWTTGLESFTKHVMPDPHIFFTSFLEAALFSRVKVFTQFSEVANKFSTVTEIISSFNNRNVVVCCSKMETVIQLAEFLRHQSVFCLLAHEKMMHYDLKSIRHQWKASSESRNNPVLLVSDPILPELRVSDAECLIHVDLPEIYKSQFSYRFSCLRDAMKQFQDVSQDKTSDVKECVSHLILDRTCQRQALDLKRFLSRLKCPIPKNLSIWAETERSTRELCVNFLAFGECQNKYRCSFRHKVRESDCPANGLPHWGKVRLYVTHVVNATYYYARLLEYRHPKTGTAEHNWEHQHAMLHVQIQNYFAGVRVKEIVTDIAVGLVCAFQNAGGVFHRVKILEVMSPKPYCLNKAIAISLDEGWTRTIQCDEFFVLPDFLISPEPQAIQIRVCNIKPLDGHQLWTSQADSYIHDLVFQQELTGKVILTLGNCIWVSPLNKRTKINSGRNIVNEFSIGPRLVRANFAALNSRHIENLKSACQGIVSWETQVFSDQAKEPTIINAAQTKYTLLEEGKIVHVSAINSPNMFFVRLAENADELLVLSGLIQRMVAEKSLPLPKAVLKGTICIAPFSIEQRWFRGRVESIEMDENKQPTRARILFLDYGDSEVVNISDLYGMIPSILDFFPFQAIECSLGGVQAPHGGWSEVAVDAFEDLTRDDLDSEIFKELEVKIVQETTSVISGTKHYTVDLRYEGRSIAEDLRKQGFAESVDANCYQSLFDSCKKSSKKNNFVTKCSSSDSEDEAYANCRDNFFLNLVYGENVVTNCSKNNLMAIEAKKEDSVDSGSKLAPKSLESSVPSDLPFLEAVQGVTPETNPNTTWCQTDEYLIFYVSVPKLKSKLHYEVLFGSRFITFRAVSAGKFYYFQEELYQIVDPEKSSSCLSGRAIKINIAKSLKGVKWPRPLSSVEEKSYLTVEINNTENDPESDDFVEIIKEKPREILHYDPSDDELNGTSDEDGNVADSNWLKTRDPCNPFDD